MVGTVASIVSAGWDAPSEAPGVAHWSQWVHFTEGLTCSAKVTVETVSRRR
jgi:hypothetical protein